MTPLALFLVFVAQVPAPIVAPDALHPTIMLILTVLGALVPLMSLFSSMLNASIRARTDKGEKIAPALTFFASLLNFVALNLDKGIQMMKMAFGQAVINTVSAPVTAAPAVAALADPAKPADAPKA